MSLTEILAEIPKLSFAERQELVRRAIGIEDDELAPEENPILSASTTFSAIRPRALRRKISGVRC